MEVKDANRQGDREIQVAHLQGHGVASSLPPTRPGKASCKLSGRGKGPPVADCGYYAHLSV